MTLLGEIGEAEVHEQRADHGLGARIVERVQLELEAPARAGVAGSSPHGPATRALHQSADLDPGLFLDDFHEEAPETARLEREGVRSRHRRPRMSRSTPSRNVRSTAAQPNAPAPARTFVS